MSVTWSSGVNNKFYDIQAQANENTITQEFESGKVRKYLKNSSMKRSFSFSFTLWSKAEETAFWTWYDEELLSGTELLSMTDLITQSGTTEYQVTEDPAVENSQYPKNVTMSVQEA